jgi:hypothetical protein
MRKQIYSEAFFLKRYGYFSFKKEVNFGSTQGGKSY